MTNLPRKTANLPRLFVASRASGGALLQVGGRLLQLVATLSGACLCANHGTVASVTAFSKTSTKKVEKKRDRDKKKRVGIQ
jgi:hypothetical protein